jgi:phosphotriesterase-related protein
MPLTEPSFRARASVGTLVLALGIVSSAVRAQSEVPDLSGRILTVQGPIDPADAGITLMHEHIFIDFRAPPPMRPPPTEISVLRAQAAGPPGRGSFGGGLTDFDESLAELTAFKAIGGGTIVDTTNFGLTRDPEVLRRISEASGLHVVMGAGWYQKALHPP